MPAKLAALDARVSQAKLFIATKVLYNLHIKLAQYVRIWYLLKIGYNCNNKKYMGRAVL
jgi:hypothetical protein